MLTQLHTRHLITLLTKDGVDCLHRWPHFNMFINTYLVEERGYISEFLKWIFFIFSKSSEETRPHFARLDRDGLFFILPAVWDLINLYFSVGFSNKKINACQDHTSSWCLCSFNLEVESLIKTEKNTHTCTFSQIWDIKMSENICFFFSILIFSSFFFYLQWLNALLWILTNKYFNYTQFDFLFAAPTAQASAGQAQLSSSTSSSIL